MWLAALIYVPKTTVGAFELPARLQGFRNRHEANRHRAEFLRNLTNYLNALPGPVLSQFDEVGLYCPRSMMIDTFTFTSMADVGVFDDNPLIHAISEGRIAAIVLNPQADPMYQSTDTFSRRWLRAMSKRYRPVDVPGLEAAQIYRPRDEPRSPADAGAAPQGNRP